MPSHAEPPAAAFAWASSEAGSGEAYGGRSTTRLDSVTRPKPTPNASERMERG